MRWQRRRRRTHISIMGGRGGDQAVVVNTLTTTSKTSDIAALAITLHIVLVGGHDNVVVCPSLSSSSSLPDPVSRYDAIRPSHSSITHLTQGLSRNLLYVGAPRASRTRGTGPRAGSMCVGCVSVLLGRVLQHERTGKDSVMA